MIEDLETSKDQVLKTLAEENERLKKWMRNKFAADAMNGLLADSGGDQPPPTLVATLAVAYADALIVALSAPTSEVKP